MTLRDIKNDVGVSVVLPAWGLAKPGPTCEDAVSGNVREPMSDVGPTLFSTAERG